MSIQSLMTPAMFMVSAEVFPISRKTACGRAGKGQRHHRKAAYGSEGAIA